MRNILDGTDHEFKRWMRNDAQHFLRPDWRRFWSAGQESDPLYRYYESIERKFSPDQPRAPAITRCMPACACGR
jgi:hypothetical protein